MRVCCWLWNMLKHKMINNLLDNTTCYLLNTFKKKLCSNVVMMTWLKIKGFFSSARCVQITPIFNICNNAVEEGPPETDWSLDTSIVMSLNLHTFKKKKKIYSNLPPWSVVLRWEFYFTTSQCIHSDYLLSQENMNTKVDKHKLQQRMESNNVNNNFIPPDDIESSARVPSRLTDWLSGCLAKGTDAKWQVTRKIRWWWWWWWC